MSRLVAVMIVLLFGSALSLVSTQYRARQLFIDLERAQGDARKLEIEWNTLQLDQTNYSKHSLIEAAARRDLHMQPATPARTQYITLAEKSAGRTGDSASAKKQDAPARLLP